MKKGICKKNGHSFSGFPVLCIFKNGSEHAGLICDVCETKKYVRWEFLGLSRAPKKAPLSEKQKRYITKNKFNFDPFYSSVAWRSLRYMAIKVHGRKCQACYATDKRVHVDHIEPRSKRPDLELTLSNLQVLCEDCNLGKSNKDSTDWRMS